MKRYGAQLKKLHVPPHLDTGEGLRLHLQTFFDKAKKVTGDYETVFGDDHAGLGARIPFYADVAVDYWRVLIEQIHDFDFSKLDYEVIGGIFERLISPEERHKYGQFYTRAEVVDLINSFCIRTGEESVLDPACGGGTFLVRAYARKRELAPGRSHAELLGDLYGGCLAVRHPPDHDQSCDTRSCPGRQLPAHRPQRFLRRACAAAIHLFAVPIDHRRPWQGAAARHRDSATGRGDRQSAIRSPGRHQVVEARRQG